MIENNDNNNRVPVKAVQLFIDNMNRLFEQNKEAVESCGRDLKDLTKNLSETLNILNQNPTNREIEDKLDQSNRCISSMLTVIKTVSVVLGLCIAAAVFGSQILFNHNYEKIIDRINSDKTFIEKIENPVGSKHYEMEKGPLEEKVDKILEKMEDETE